MIVRQPGHLTRCIALLGIGAVVLMVTPPDGDPAISLGDRAAPGAIAFKCGDWLCLGRPDGSGRRRLLSARLRYPFPQWDPAFSPDARQLAFRGYFASGDGSYALYVTGTDGCSPHMLTKGATNPSWSPDGAWIAFDTSGGGTLWKIRPDGSGLTRIDTGLPGDRDSFPAWSPDGASIAFVHEDRIGRGQIWVVRAHGRATLLHTDAGSSDASPAWSPDGTRIAFVVQTRQRARIDVMNADGSRAHALVTSFYDTWNPVWAPRSSAVAYLSGIIGGTGAIRTPGPDRDAGRVALPPSPQFAWTPTDLPPRRC